MTPGAEVGTLTRCRWKRTMVRPLWETAWQFLKRVETVTIGPSNSHPSYASTRNEKIQPMTMCARMFTAAAPTRVKKVETT